MGGLSYGLQSQNNINPYNPASYSRLFWTSFEAALITRNYWLESSGQAQQANITNFNHLAMGFPLAPWWGMAFAIMPVSQIGYDYSTSHSFLTVDSNNVFYDNEFIGKGGLNKVLLGHGFSINRSLFLGFNFSYYFGDMEYQETVDFNGTEDYNNSASLERIETGDIYFDFGGQYRTNIGENWRMDLGAIFIPLQGLKSKRSDFNFTFSDISGSPRIIDTVSFSKNASFSIVLPPKYGFGVLFNRSDKLRAGFDFDYTLWSLSNYNTFGGLKDVYSVKTGFEYTNKDEKYILRFGGKYATLPMVIDGSRSDEMSVTAGLALPFRSKDKLSYTVLNIGVEVGRRGKLEESWLLEKYIKVNVGLTLNNKWFIKRVYD